MSSKNEFMQLQRRTYSSYHQDGLIDILIGWMMIGFGLNIAFDNSAFLFFSWMPIFLYLPFKNRITVPRVGNVKFSAPNTKLYIVVVALLLVFMLGIIYLLIAGPGVFTSQLSAWLRGNYLLLLGGLIALLFLGGGLMTGITRLYAYAGLTIIIFMGGNLLSIQPLVFVLIMGLLVEVVGIVMLIRFLRKYTLTSGESTYES
jgi:hypothetical protein